jgi:hypothetical protein
MLYIMTYTSIYYIHSGKGGTKRDRGKEGGGGGRGCTEGWEKEGGGGGGGGAQFFTDLAGNTFQSIESTFFPFVGR